MSDQTEDQIRKGLKLLAEDVQAPECEAGRHTRTWFLPGISSRLGVALAGAAICATLGALAAAGTFSGGHKAAVNDHPAKRPPRIGSGLMPYILPVWAMFKRAGDGTLSSVNVRIHSYTAHDSIQLRVVHSTPTGGESVVYTMQVSTGDITSSCPSGRIGTTGPTGATGATGASGLARYCFNMGSSWSGTLVPSDWNGGCQTIGDYWIETSAGDDRSNRFTCDAVHAGPTGESGTTGAAGSTG